jgi:hypothetical protein
MVLQQQSAILILLFSLEMSDLLAAKPAEMPLQSKLFTKSRIILNSLLATSMAQKPF